MTEHQLIDHHCHGVIGRDLDRTGFELLLTEAGSVGPQVPIRPTGRLGAAAGSTEPSGSTGPLVPTRSTGRLGPAGLIEPLGSTEPLAGSLFDSQIGFAVRRWCAPLLDLDPHVAPDAYLERRNELGHAEVAGRMLRAAGLEALCVDTGFEPEPLLSPAELGRAAGASSYEIVRLEQVAEQVTAEILRGGDSGGGSTGHQAGGGSVGGFAEAIRSRLAERARVAVGFKSIAAYRYGLELSGERPTDAEAAAAADRWLTGLQRQHGVAGVGSTLPIRLADETLHRFLIWCAIDLGLPVQFHVGYGDSDVDLDRCDPLLLTRLLRAVEPTGVPIMLLHNYPFHRHAGYLAQVFSNVFIDVGLATHNLGRGSKAVIAEALELAPFGKVLYSSDAFGLPELYYLGARLFRRGLADFLNAGVAEADWTAADAERVTRMICAENARRVYRLDAHAGGFASGDTGGDGAAKVTA